MHSCHHWWCASRVDDAGHNTAEKITPYRISNPTAASTPAVRNASRNASACNLFDLTKTANALCTRCGVLSFWQERFVICGLREGAVRSFVRPSLLEARTPLLLSQLLLLRYSACKQSDRPPVRFLLGNLQQPSSHAGTRSGQQCGHRVDLSQPESI